MHKLEITKKIFENLFRKESLVKNHTQVNLVSYKLILFLKNLKMLGL